MANGYCPCLVKDVLDVAQGAANRLSVAGFLQMLFCCQNSSVSPLNDAYAGGANGCTTLKYRPRPVLSAVGTTDDCGVDTFPVYSEWNVPALSYAQTSFFIPDSLLQRYCADAFAPKSVGQPPTQVANEIYLLIVEAANLLLSYIDKDLVSQMATQFGKNIANGSSTGTVINIGSGGDSLNLSNGIIQIMRDLQENEICDAPCIVGGGIFAGYNMAIAAACCNAAGIDASKFAIPDFYFDKNTNTYWGTNTIGIFAKGSVKFLSRNRYTGIFAGDRGTSFFTTLPLPVNEFACAQDCLKDLRFDLQLKYIDCPDPAYNNERGLQGILSKYYGLFVMPDVYQTGDPLDGSNGTWKYFVQNSAYTGGAYAYTG